MYQFNRADLWILALIWYGKRFFWQYGDWKYGRNLVVMDGQELKLGCVSLPHWQKMVDAGLVTLDPITITPHGLFLVEFVYFDEVAEDLIAAGYHFCAPPSHSPDYYREMERKSLTLKVNA